MMSERSFKNSGIRFARVRGIDFWIHWSLLLWFGYVLYQAWIDEGTWWEAFLSTGVWYLVVFATILFHEIGHCVFAARQGGGADAIVLWPLGGLAYCDAPHLPWNQFWVAAGGPIFQLLPTALAGGALLILGLAPGPFPSSTDSLLSTALSTYVWWNLAILTFNLIPVYPLDGGRMFQAILWGKLKSHGRATLVTIWASRITIFSLLLVGFFVKDRSVGWLSWPGVFILFWALFETEKLRVRLQAGEEGEDYVFGYDFSRGYTSLERTATRDQRKAPPSLIGKLRTRSRENRETREAEINRRIDALLEKISKEGLPSLTRRERKFLSWASKRMRRG